MPTLIRCKHNSVFHHFQCQMVSVSGKTYMLQKLSEQNFRACKNRKLWGFFSSHTLNFYFLQNTEKLFSRPIMSTTGKPIQIFLPPFFFWKKTTDGWNKFHTGSHFQNMILLFFDTGLFLQDLGPCGYFQSRPICCRYNKGTPDQVWNMFWRS